MTLIVTVVADALPASPVAVDDLHDIIPVDGAITLFDKLAVTFALAGVIVVAIAEPASAPGTGIMVTARNTNLIVCMGARAFLPTARPRALS